MEEEDRGGRTENIKVICQPQRALKGGGGRGGGEYERRWEEERRGQQTEKQKRKSSSHPVIILQAEGKCSWRGEGARQMTE